MGNLGFPLAAATGALCHGAGGTVFADPVYLGHHGYKDSLDFRLRGNNGGGVSMVTIKRQHTIKPRIPSNIPANRRQKSFLHFGS